MNFSSLFGWLHDNQALMAMLHDHWSWGICLVALILFLETGLVVLPFLPGDSLLFAVGAFMGIFAIFESLTTGIGLFIDSFNVEILVAPSEPRDPEQVVSLIQESFGDQIEAIEPGSPLQGEFHG